MRVHHCVTEIDKPGLTILGRVVDPVVPLLRRDVVQTLIDPFLLDPGLGLAPVFSFELALAGFLPLVSELLREQFGDLLGDLLFLLLLSLDSDFLIKVDILQLSRVNHLHLGVRGGLVGGECLGGQGPEGN